MKPLPAKVWNIRDTTSLPVHEKLLAGRGISFDQMESFLKPSLDELSSPAMFRDMSKSIERIEQAINQKERIIVFGDYDVDGVSGSAILVRTLLKLGAYVSYRLPHRVNDGYGLKNYLIDEIAETGATVLITVDNGISARNEIAYAQEQGIDVIITDHHSVPPDLPPAFAILHPKLETETYPFKDLSGSGVAFMFARGLLEHFLGEAGSVFWLQMIDLASLGTVADCVPLVGENRIIVHYGLKQLAQTTHIGLQHLMNLAQVNLREIDSHTIGFLIGPRLNAGGRMDTAIDSLHLFLYGEEKSREVAQKLHDLNIKRQQETEKIVQEAMQRLEHENTEHIIVLEGDWHLGIIGIVAAKLADKYHVPAFVLGRKRDEYVASCRNEGQTNIIELIRHFKEYFTHFGGHEGAAGFSIQEDKLPDFKARIQAFVAEKNATTTKTIPVEIETFVLGSDLSWDLYSFMEKLGPFGEGNPKPLLALEQATIKEIRTVGSKNQHLKLVLEHEHRSFHAIGFSLGEVWAPVLQKNDSIDVAFEVEKNTFNGNTNLSLVVRDIRRKT